MKVRYSFVSNSSSSSFVIGCKTKPTRDMLLKVLNVDKESPLYTFAVDVSKCLANVEEKTMKDIVEDWGDVPKDFENIFTKGMKLWMGDASSDADDPAEIALVDLGIKYESDDLIIIKEAGY
jgi:hypothetical protein